MPAGRREAPQGRTRAGRGAPRKTHDLASLADEAARLLPALAPLADPLRPRTLWSFAFRYPLDEGVEEPEPTVTEVRQVLAQIAALRTAVLRAIEGAGDPAGEPSP